MFYFKDKFLSKDECEHLIKFWKDYPEEDKIIHNSTKVARLIRRSSGDRWIDDMFRYIGKKCAVLVDEDIICDNAEIVRWKPNQFMKPHKDYTDICSVVIYLNDDYEGGETGVRFNDPRGQELIVEPKQGRILVFSNGTLAGHKDGYWHWVNKVKKSERYTLGLWYRRSNGDEYVT